MKKAILVLPLILALFFSGCNKDPVKPDNDNDYKGPSRIDVSVTDSQGKTLAGQEVFFNLIRGKENEDKFLKFMKSDESGKAYIDSLSNGNYRVIVQCRGIYNDCNVFFRDEVTIEENRKVVLKYSIPVKIDMKLDITSSYQLYLSGPWYDKKLAGTKVIISPGNYSVVADESGCAYFKNIPVGKYDVKATRNNMTLQPIFSIDTYQYLNGKLVNNYCWFENQKPKLKITSPLNNDNLDISEVILKCETNDFEDGPLPDSSLVWYSMTDGELGKGNDLHVNHLSTGKQKIRLTGTDSMGGQSDVSINLTVTFSDNSSWYPYPPNSYWNYSFNVDDLIVNYNGDMQEKWKLSGMKAVTEGFNSRKCTMEYDIIRGNETRHCSYSVKDFYDYDENNIYMAKTIEKLQLYKPESAVISESIDIETVYNSSLLLISNHKGLKAGENYSAMSIASVKNTYYNELYGKGTDYETKKVNALYTPLESEMIDTPAGKYGVLPLVIENNGTVKKWWLAKGVGIVKMDYNISGDPVTAVLTDTNLLSYSGSAKKPMKFRFNNSPRLKFKEKSGTKESMIEIAGILKKICPR